MDIKILACVGMFACILFGFDIYVALGVASVIGLIGIGLTRLGLAIEQHFARWRQ